MIILKLQTLIILVVNNFHTEYGSNNVNFIRNSIIIPLIKNISKIT